MTTVGPATTDASVDFEASGSIAGWSTGAEEALGWARHEALGRNLIDSIVAPDARSRFRAGVRSLVGRHPAEGAGARVRVPMLHRRGHHLMVDVVLLPAGDDRLHQALLFAAKGPAEAEAQPPATEGRVPVAGGRAEDHRGRFVADAAHQLRTPVAGIQACAETLLAGVAADKRDPLLARIVQETSRAARLVSDLLRMVQLDEGTSLRPAACDIATICADECDRLYALAPALDVVFGLTAPFVALPVLDADAVREILANLLDNARRHARERVEVVVGPADGMVEVRVIDDGAGLAPELIEVAFERFVSLDARGGSGLGLPIARSLAWAHGGELAYEDGAFVLRLPAHGPPASGTAPPA